VGNRAECVLLKRGNRWSCNKPLAAPLEGEGTWVERDPEKLGGSLESRLKSAGSEAGKGANYSGL